jgi:hypothetical protein
VALVSAAGGSIVSELLSLLGPFFFDGGSMEGWLSGTATKCGHASHDKSTSSQQVNTTGVVCTSTSSQHQSTQQ